MFHNGYGSDLLELDEQHQLNRSSFLSLTLLDEQEKLYRTLGRIASR